MGVDIERFLNGSFALRGQRRGPIGHATQLGHLFSAEELAAVHPADAAALRPDLDERPAPADDVETLAVLNRGHGWLPQSETFADVEGRRADVRFADGRRTVAPRATAGEQTEKRKKDTQNMAPVHRRSAKTSSLSTARRIGSE